MNIEIIVFKIFSTDNLAEYTQTKCSRWWLKIIIIIKEPFYLMNTYFLFTAENSLPTICAK